MAAGIEDLKDYLTPSSPSFIFGGNTGLTYEQLQTRRKIAEQLLARRSKFPQTFGEGLTYAGEQLGGAIEMRQLDAADRAYQAWLAGQGGEATKALPVGAGTPAPASIAVPPAAPTATTEAPDAAPAEPTSAAIEAPTRREVIANNIETVRNGGGGGAVPLPPPRPVYNRNAQLQELQDNPELADRIRTIARGESADPREQQIVAETVFNRAAARGTSLARETEARTGPGSRGYYPPETFRRGMAANDILTPVLRGSDLGGELLRTPTGDSFTPTGNASGGVAQRGVASGRYNASGRLPGSAETYVQQEPPAQLQRLAASRVPGRDAIAAAMVPAAPGFGRTAALMQQPSSTLTDAQVQETTRASIPAPMAALTPPQINEIAQGSRPGAAAPLPLNPPIATDIMPAPSATRMAEAPGANVPPPPPVAAPPPIGRTPMAPVEFLQKPDPPKPLPMTQEEASAVRRMMMAPGDPNVQRIWGPVAQAHAAQREFQNARNVKAYEADLERWKANYEANQTFARGAEERALRLAQERAKLPQGSTDQGPPAGEYDPRLGTRASPQRSGVPEAAPVPPGAIPLEHAKQQTIEAGKSVAAYRTALPKFTEALNTLEQLRRHPGQELGLGATSAIATKIPGSSAYGFNALRNQLAGTAFLEAYTDLKGGGGNISNIEGDKATQAKARLDAAQSPADFHKALNDLQLQLQGDLERAQRAVNQPVTAYRLPGDNSTFAPDVNQKLSTYSPEMFQKIGREKIYIGGNPRRPESWRDP